MQAQDTTQELIARLSKGHEKIKCLGCPLRRALGLFALVVLYNVVLLSFDAVRSDLNIRLENSIFLFELFLPFVISLSAFISLSFLMIPDMKGYKGILWISPTLFFVFLVWMGVSFFEQGYIQGHLFPDTHCFKDGLLYATLPVAFVAFMIRKGATTQRGWMILMSILSVSFIGWISLRFVCSLDSASHVFINHFLPFIVLGAVFGLLGKRLFSW